MINLDTAKYHLRIDDDAAEAEVLQKLRMADAIVRTYLANPEAPTIITLADYLAEPQPDIYNEQAMVGDATRDAAVLLVLGELWGNREAQSLPLSKGVRDLLDMLRGPTWA